MSRCVDVRSFAPFLTLFLGLALVRAPLAGDAGMAVRGAPATAGPVPRRPAAVDGRCCDMPVVVSPLRLNEILAGPATDWDGSGTFSSRDDEWIEIANTSGGAVDLAPFFVTDGDSIPRYALNGVLDAGAILWVTGRMSYDWERANGQPAFGLSLGNAGDAVLLWQVSGPDTTLVDGYAFSSHEAAADRSVGRSLDTGEWELFDALDPYTGTVPPQGNHCPPSPGAPNACTSVPVRNSTWGRLKATYR